MAATCSIASCLVTIGVVACMPDAGGTRAAEAPRGVAQMEVLGRIPTDVALDDTTLFMPTTLDVGGGRLFVADRLGPTVRVVHQSGELELVLGRGGGGPGEMQLIRGVAVTDIGNQRVTLFGGDGSFVRDWPLDGGIGYIASDAAGRLHIAQLTGSSVVSVYSPEGERLRTYGRYVGGSKPIADRRRNAVRFAPMPDGGMSLLYTFRGEVDRYTADGRRVATIRLPIDANLPLRGPFIQYVDENTFAITRLPVADDIAVDEHGRLYVAMLRKSGHGYATRLLELDSTGQTFGHLNLDFRARSMAYDDGRIYGLCTRSCPAPHVVVLGRSDSQQGVE